MVLKTIRGVIFGALSLVGSVVFAEDAPSLPQVYEAAQAGHLDQAQAMMDKVLQAHPSSAKAHFVEAEIMAKQGRIANAQNELSTAEHLAPGLPFAKPQSVQLLKSKLEVAQRGQQLTSVPHAPTASGLPWSGLLIGVSVLFLLVYFIRGLTASRRVGYMPSAMGTPGQSYPGGAVGPMSSTGGGMGSSIVSGLATGAAMGAGMVAGEALVHHFMNGNNGAPMAPVADAGDLSSGALGGDDFGVVDNSASWDDAGGGGMADLGGGDWS